MLFILSPARRGGRRALTVALVGAALALANAGCATRPPCLQYTPQLYTKTVSMRGYGSVQVTKETMVCTQRAEVEVATR